MNRTVLSRRGIGRVIAVLGGLGILLATNAAAIDAIDWRVVRRTAPERWSTELKAQLVEAGYNLRQLAQRVRQYQATQAAPGEGSAAVEPEAAEPMRVAQERARGQIDWDLVVATAPEAWSTELKNLLTQAGCDLRQLAQRVRAYQAGQLDAATVLEFG
ncbi:MAG: hypothetical protein WDA75_19505, partial [Candidatus Latescibacterota bacterium]